MDGSGLSRNPQKDGAFATIPGWLSDAKLLKLKADDFEDWAYRNIRITVLANEKLKVYGSPGEDREGFLERCRREAASIMDKQLDLLEDKYKKKIDALEDKIRKQEGEVALREQKVTQHTMDTVASAGSTIIGMLMGRKRSLGSSITKTRMTTEARSMLTREKKELEDMKDDLEELEREFDEKQDELAKQVGETAEQVVETPYLLKKSDIFMSYYGIAWLPYYVFMDGNYVREVRAFEHRG
jgi:septin family protein